MKGMKFLYAAIEYFNQWIKSNNVMKDFYWQQYQYNLKMWKELN